MGVKGNKSKISWAAITQPTTVGGRLGSQRIRETFRCQNSSTVSPFHWWPTDRAKFFQEISIFRKELLPRIASTSVLQMHFRTEDSK